MSRVVRWSRNPDILVFGQQKYFQSLNYSYSQDWVKIISKCHLGIYSDNAKIAIPIMIYIWRHAIDCILQYFKLYNRYLLFYFSAAINFQHPVFVLCNQIAAKQCSGKELIYSYSTALYNAVITLANFEQKKRISSSLSCELRPKG